MMSVRYGSGSMGRFLDRYIDRVEKPLRNPHDTKRETAPSMRHSSDGIFRRVTFCASVAHTVTISDVK